MERLTIPRTINVQANVNVVTEAKVKVAINGFGRIGASIDRWRAIARDKGRCGGVAGPSDARAWLGEDVRAWKLVRGYFYRTSRRGGEGVERRRW